MSFFGSKRSRQHRVFRPTLSLADRVFRTLRDHRALSLILLSVLAIAGLQAATQLGAPRFSFREGEPAAWGIQSRVSFRVVNEEKSRLRRDAVAQAAPWVLRQGEVNLELLKAELRNELSEVANSEGIDQVSDSTLRSFGFLAAQADQADAMEADFVVFRNLLSDSDGSTGNRIDAMMQDFESLMEDVTRVGLITLKEVQDFEELDESGFLNKWKAPFESTDSGSTAGAINSDAAVAADDTGSVESADGADAVKAAAARNLAELSRVPIRVVGEDGGVLQDGVIADVLVSEVLKDSGRLGKNWPALQNLVPLRDYISIWLEQHAQNLLETSPELAAQFQQQLMDETEPVYDGYNAEDILVAPGDRVNAAQLILLQAESLKFENQVTLQGMLHRQIGWCLCLTIVVLLAGKFLHYTAPSLLFDGSRMFVFVMMCCCAVFFSCLASEDFVRGEIVPLIAVVMTSAIVYGRPAAVISAICLPPLVSMATVATPSHLLELLIVSIFSALVMRELKSRLVMLRAGLYLGGLAVLVRVSANGMQFSESAIELDMTTAAFDVLRFGMFALMACYLVAMTLPLIESAFGIVTDISLLELSGVSHPLLQELARRAPGTYNHSITVASMAEAAAEAIGANGLLTRVGAYFHDIGKMLKAEYFIENMLDSGENPHSSLAPAMSTLIIIGHVRDGLELAEANGLPPALHPFIAEHHGTTLVEYSFNEAARKADGDHRTDASESSFRYPGPRPQTRETAVLMLADAVESASRTLKEPTPRRIQSLVNEITMKRLLDGQFDECNLQMNEIRLIEDSLIKSLLAAHHGRVRYPGQKTA